MNELARRYAWVEGFHSRLSAEDAGNELDRIRQAEGTLTPGVVVDAARDPSNILHTSFEWDDAIAGEKYRIVQAGKLIRSLRVVPRVGASPQPAMLSVQTGEKKNERSYATVRDVMNDPAARRQFLIEELDRIIRLLERTSAYPEMEPLRKAADDVMDAMIVAGSKARKHHQSQAAD